MLVNKCKNCGKDFSYEPLGSRPRIYCCDRCRQERFRKDSPESLKKSRKKWLKKNPNYNKEWRNRNPDKVKKYLKDYNLSHKEILRIRARKWREENPEKNMELKRIWRSKNKERVNECYNKRYHSKYKKDPQFKLAKNLRHRVNKVLLGINRSKKTLDLLGVSSVGEIKIYLENLFKDGMNWNNYGNKGWHVDHIRPLDSFDLTIETERLKAFNYKNLQPLWAIENLSKSNKYIKK